MKQLEKLVRPLTNMKEISRGLFERTPPRNPWSSKNNGERVQNKQPSRSLCSAIFIPFSTSASFSSCVIELDERWPRKSMHCHNYCWSEIFPPRPNGPEMFGRQEISWAWFPKGLPRAGWFYFRGRAHESSGTIVARVFISFCFSWWS